jgi:hypothetical protein
MLVSSQIAQRCGLRHLHPARFLIVEARSHCELATRDVLPLCTYAHSFTHASTCLAPISIRAHFERIVLNSPEVQRKVMIGLATQDTTEENLICAVASALLAVPLPSPAPVTQLHRTECGAPLQRWTLPRQMPHFSSPMLSSQMSLFPTFLPSTTGLTAQIQIAQCLPGWEWVPHLFPLENG